MKVLKKPLLPQVILVALFVVYVIWSQFQISQLTKKLSIEKNRVFSIARNLELWKKLTLEYDGKLDVKRLSLDQKELEIEQIDREDSGIRPDEKLFVMYYNSPPNTRELKRYTSDLVLGGYLSIVTDSDLRIKSLGWDKP